MNKQIVILAGEGKSSNIIYNALSNEFEISKLVIEKRISRFILIKKRIKSLGAIKVLGQILFSLFALPLINLEAKKRLNELYLLYNLNNKLIINDNIQFIDSVNSNTTIELLNRIKPKLVIVNGTRIISKKVLSKVACDFINIHVGITPKYRGVHGGYWALVNNDLKYCGVTIHFIDEGIDTGNIIYQEIIEPTHKDNFITYPLLQLNTGINLLKKTITDFFDGEIKVKKNSLVSKLWTHPTLWEYIKFRFLKGVK